MDCIYNLNPINGELNLFDHHRKKCSHSSSNMYTIGTVLPPFKRGDFWECASIEKKDNSWFIIFERTGGRFFVKWEWDFWLKIPYFFASAVSCWVFCELRRFRWCVYVPVQCKVSIRWDRTIRYESFMFCWKCAVWRIHFPTRWTVYLFIYLFIDLDLKFAKQLWWHCT